jgi:glycosyltransferase involved in cell wall biosynthesis
MQDLKISIIMPSFNQAAYIDEAINSVLSQDYPNKELIVIDGGSTDGSVEVIQHYSEQLAYWVSEPDSGQSNAINKGFAQATGHLLTWSNSDDILLPGTLSLVAQAAAAISDARQRWIAGGCFWLNPQGNILRCTHARPWRQTVAQSGMVPVYSPSSFFSREMLDEVGVLDENLHYAMDSELWLRFAQHGMRYTASKGHFWGLRLHPNAKVSGHMFDGETARKHNPVLKKRQLEAEKIRLRYGITEADTKSSQLLSKLISVLSAEFWVDKANTLKYQGQPWQQCISSIQ